MAYIEGYPGSKIKGLTLRHTAFLFLVSVTVIGIILYFSEGWLEDIRTMAAILAVMALFIIGGSVKANPMAWKSIINKSEFERLLGLDRMIADHMEKLDDDHFIIHDFRFELFHVEHLVISPRGIFVVHKIRHGEPLSVRDDMLFSGDHCLEKYTSNLWRICHLINIVFRKGYKEDLMPKPILVSPEADSVALSDYKGISIVGLPGLCELITRGEKEVLSPDLARSFAYFVKSKYT